MILHTTLKVKEQKSKISGKINKKCAKIIPNPNLINNISYIIQSVYIVTYI